MRRRSADYKREVKDELFELELEATTGKGDKAEPVVVTFVRGSSDLPLEVIDLMGDWSKQQELGTNPREVQLRYLLGNDDPTAAEPKGPAEDAYQKFWAEWKKKSRRDLDALINDVDKHFGDGVEAGKGLSSVG